MDTSMTSLPDELIAAILDLLDPNSVRCFLRTCKEYALLDTPRIHAAKYRDDLNLACIRGDLVAVKYLDNINVNINQALTYAALSDHIPVVKYLVNNHAVTITWDNPALRHAAHRGYLDVIICLVDAGVDITAAGNEALGIAAHSGHLDVVKYLVNTRVCTDVTDDDNYALRAATMCGHDHVVEYLISAGAYYNNIIVYED
jgi:ankyrin repeat protein